MTLCPSLYSERHISPVYNQKEIINGARLYSETVSPCLYSLGPVQLTVDCAIERLHRPMVQAVSCNNLPQYPLQYLTVFNISITISFQYHYPIHSHSIPFLHLTIIIPNQVLHKSLTISNLTIHTPFKPQPSLIRIWYLYVILFKNYHHHQDNIYKNVNQSFI